MRFNKNWCSLYRYIYPFMSDIKQYPELEFITEKIKKAITDATLQKESAAVSIIKDGNDVIHIEQTFAVLDNTAIISITDKKEILYSEDLLEELQDVHLETKTDTELHAALKVSSIVINGLSVQTEFVFQAVKDCFDTLSSSYQFVKIIRKNVNSLTIDFKFGDHKFQIVVTNNPDEVSITVEFGSEANPKVNQTIAADVAKVQQALNKLFKD